MNFKQIITGKNSLYFFVGCYALIAFIMLQKNIKTDFYIELTSIFHKSPLVTLLISFPCIFIIGILIDIIKESIYLNILKISPYNYNLVPEEAVKAINNILIAELLLFEKNSFDKNLQSLKILLLPEFDEYKIQQKWVLSLLENIILISCYTIIVVICRKIASDFDQIDLLLLNGSLIVSLFSIVHIKNLKPVFTNIEISLILQQYSNMIQNNNILKIINNCSLFKV